MSLWLEDEIKREKESGRKSLVDLDIRIEVEGKGSWIWCSLGECTLEEAQIHLNSESYKWFHNPDRKGESFGMYLEVHQPTI